MLERISANSLAERANQRVCIPTAIGQRGSVHHHKTHATDHAYIESAQVVANTARAVLEPEVTIRSTFKRTNSATSD